MIESIANLFSSVAPLVTKVLLHSLWQGTLIALLLSLALLVFRHRSAQVRYVMACLALVFMVLTAGGTATYLASAEGNLSATTTADISTPSEATSSEHQPGVEAVSADLSGERPSGGTFTVHSLQTLVFPLWAAGVLLLSLFHLIGWRRVSGLKHRDTEPVSELWQERFLRLCDRTGLQNAVRLLGSSVARVPCVVGWIKPVVLVPLSCFTGLDDRELEMIILHELAHVRRHDVLVGYLQAIAEILFFFSPAVWWVSRKIRTEREHCCDDLAVALSGDRISYARALISLAERRFSRTRLVAAADSTPLLQRVRRILGTPTDNDQPSRGSIGGFLLLTALLALSLTAFSGPTYSDTRPETTLEPSEQVEPERGDITGEWEVEYQARQHYIRIKFGRNWSTGFSIDAEEFLRNNDLNSTHFKLTRDAGTFYLEGRLEKDGDELRGSGDCFFRANPDYVEAMRDLSYNVDGRKDALTLAVHDVTLEFARGLEDLGYDNLSFNRLIEAHIHRVTPEFIRELDDLGYHDLSMSRLVEMRIHGAEPDFIREMADRGYRNLSPQRLVEMRVHDVEPEYVEEMASLGYKDLSPSKLVEMQIHNLEPDFVRDLAKLGYDNLSESKLVEFKIHGVDPDFIAELAELGYDDLSPSRLVEFRIHNVTPRYIRQLAELGYRDISSSRLVEMKVHDVSPSYIKRLQGRYDNLSPRELIEFKIHGR